MGGREGGIGKVAVGARWLAVGCILLVVAGWLAAKGKVGWLVGWN